MRLHTWSCSGSSISSKSQRLPHHEPRADRQHICRQTARRRQIQGARIRSLDKLAPVAAVPSKLFPAACTAAVYYCRPSSASYHTCQSTENPHRGYTFGKYSGYTACIVQEEWYHAHCPPCTVRHFIRVSYRKGGVYQECFKSDVRAVAPE